MNAFATLGVGVAGMAGLTGVVGAVALVASPINRIRDDRRAAAEQAAADALITQIRAGTSFALGLNADPIALAAAAYRLAEHLYLRIGPDGKWAMWHTMEHLTSLIESQGLDLPDHERIALTPLGDAAALQVLLHRLQATHLRTASVAGGYVADAIRYLPDGTAVDFGPLHECDPAPLHAAHAEWGRIADSAGMLPDVDAVQTIRSITETGASA